MMLLVPTASTSGSRARCANPGRRSAWARPSPACSCWRRPRALETRAGRVLVGTSGWLLPPLARATTPGGCAGARAHLFGRAVAHRRGQRDVLFVDPALHLRGLAPRSTRFMFAIKGSRFITHMLKLRIRDTAGELLRVRLAASGGALGPDPVAAPSAAGFDADRARALFRGPSARSGRRRALGPTARRAHDRAGRADRARWRTGPLRFARGPTPVPG